MKADTPIALADLTQMSPEEREILLLGIRELSLMQAQARKEGLEKQWSKQLEMFAKELERADKAFDKVQARHTKLRALELEMETL